jgi:hypothetical protein
MPQGHSDPSRACTRVAASASRTAAAPSSQQRERRAKGDDENSRQVSACGHDGRLHQTPEAFLMNHRFALQTAAVGTTHALMPLSGPVPVTLVYRGQRQSSKRGAAGGGRTSARSVGGVGTEHGSPQVTTPDFPFHRWEIHPGQVLERVEAKQHARAERRKQRRGNQAHQLEGDLGCGQLAHEDGQDIGYHHAQQRRCHRFLVMRVESCPTIALSQVGVF